ncbi:aminotransferase class III-fold pyridoxal phosphate-dependent enzyme [Mesorhizobium sp. 1M-11]|uniref:aminotransferase class III-fold pyridoxal phosphate-dependent enzyme n=1 Tax=Mesorhizobium sp. 1M-11 TaxID=1529006 RepID=UPI000A98A2F7|nr:aminotransferase class III-fold pyridoxal phosphate-dependent enzyme [Mesorhizobium sp. 1M-11]
MSNASPRQEMSPSHTAGGRYRTSEEMLDEALRIIPLGSQTFSKSLTQYPRGVSPFFIQRGDGSVVWDVDGNSYTDFNNGLCSVTLGHADADVNAAVLEQLKDGISFPLAHPLETIVAELIIEMVPSAEMVRFGKNGSDATSGAIRAARAFTGRERVAMCGYHGWQDWYIGSTARNKGVPKAIRELSHVFPYNDLEALDKVLSSHPGEFAAVILEPMNTTFPKEGYLQGMIDLAHKHGAIAIFDETITGFRYSEGGAQQLFGVKPDLACFGKGLANGYPLSAVAGRADVMAEFAEIFFSFTMGGEAMSLAAAQASLKKIRSHNVIEKLNATGNKIADGVKALIVKHGCENFLGFAGHPTWSFLTMNDANGSTSFEIKTLWMQEILARGLISVGTHNVSFAHSDADVAKLLNAYDEIFPLLRDAVENKAIRQYLRCEPLVPLFRLR